MSTDLVQHPTSYATEANLVWLLDSCARLVLTHRLDRALVEWALGVYPFRPDLSVAPQAVELDAEQRERLALLVNILIRLEIRLRGDSRLLREALTTPLAALEGHTPAETMTGVERMRAVRHAVADMPVPQIWMWRCANTYG